MKKVLCSIVVEVDEKVIKKQGYENIEEYLNECRFCVYNDEHDDICVEVREYDEIGEWTNYPSFEKGKIKMFVCAYIVMGYIILLSIIQLCNEFNRFEARGLNVLNAVVLIVLSVLGIIGISL